MPGRGCIMKSTGIEVVEWLSLFEWEVNWCAKCDYGVVTENQ